MWEEEETQSHGFVYVCDFICVNSKQFQLWDSHSVKYTSYCTWKGEDQLSGTFNVYGRKRSRQTEIEIE